MSLRVITAIAHKDLVDAVKNTYILFALILPVGMSLLFTLMVPSRGQLPEIALHDAGQSGLVAALTNDPAVQVVVVDSAEAVRQRVERGATGGLVLPANFDAAVAAGTTPELQGYYNGQRSASRSTFQRTVETALHTLAGQALPARLVLADVSGTANQASGDPNLTSFLLPFVLVLGATMVGVFIVPTILVEEKEKHTLHAMLVSPASYADVVAGKALVGLVFALLIGLLLLLLNDGFVGNPAITLLAIVLGALFLVQCGLLLAAILSTTAQVNTWSSIVMLVLLIPALFSLPPQPPPPVSTVIRLIPTGAMADAIIIGLSNTGSVGKLWLDVLVLATATGLMFGGIIWALRRERR
jgi:ABC-2 type transport system permease protein